MATTSDVPESCRGNRVEKTRDSFEQHFIETSDRRVWTSPGDKTPFCPGGVTRILTRKTKRASFYSVFSFHSELTAPHETQSSFHWLLYFFSPSESAQELVDRQGSGPCRNLINQDVATGTPRLTTRSCVLIKAAPRPPQPQYAQTTRTRGGRLGADSAHYPCDRA